MTVGEGQRVPRLLLLSEAGGLSLVGVPAVEVVEVVEVPGQYPPTPPAPRERPDSRHSFDLFGHVLRQCRLVASSQSIVVLLYVFGRPPCSLSVSSSAGTGRPRPGGTDTHPPTLEGLLLGTGQYSVGEERSVSYSTQVFVRLVLVLSLSLSVCVCVCSLFYFGVVWR